MTSTRRALGVTARDWAAALIPAVATYVALLTLGWAWTTPRPGGVCAVLATAAALVGAALTVPVRRAARGFSIWAALWVVAGWEVLARPTATDPWHGLALWSEPDRLVPGAAWLLLWVGVGVTSGRALWPPRDPPAVPPPVPPHLASERAGPASPWLSHGAAQAGCLAAALAGLGLVAAALGVVLPGGSSGQGTGAVGLDRAGDALAAWLPGDRPGWAIGLQAAALAGVPALAIAEELRRRFARARTADLLAGLPTPPRLDGIEAVLRRVCGDADLIVRAAGAGEAGDGGDAPNPRDARLHDDVPGRVAGRRRGPGPPRRTLPVIGSDGAILAQVSVAVPSGVRLVTTLDALAVCAPALENLVLQDRLRAHLEQAQAAREGIVAAAIGERRRLVRDLHDGVQQRLLAVSTRLALARYHLSDDPAERRGIDAVATHVSATLAGVRALTRELYPPSLQTSGVMAALDGCVDDCPIDLTVTGDIDGVDAATGLLVLLTVRDTTSGLARAGACAATVHVRRDEEGVGLTMHIKGTSSVRGSSPAWLSVVMDRVSAVGGAVTLGSEASAPTDGRTRVEVWIPCMSCWSTTHPSSGPAWPPS